MGTTISVIIPVKNEESKIETCLKAVFSQTLKPCEVIVVDGHSTDKTVENALKFPVQLYYEEYPTRAGANNVGDAIIQLLVDSDLRAAMEENVKIKAGELSWDSIAKKHLMLYNSLLES